LPGTVLATSGSVVLKNKPLENKFGDLFRYEWIEFAGNENYKKFDCGYTRQIKVIQLFIRYGIYQQPNCYLLLDRHGQILRDDILIGKVKFKADFVVFNKRIIRF